MCFDIPVNTSQRYILRCWIEAVNVFLFALFVLFFALYSSRQRKLALYNSLEVHPPAAVGLHLTNE
jgi:hypothetical protein